MIQAILKSPQSEISLNTFKAYFQTKMNEIWRHIYRSENTSNDVFHFSVDIIGFEFQPMAFPRVGFSLILSGNWFKRLRLYPRKFRGSICIYIIYIIKI